MKITIPLIIITVKLLIIVSTIMRKREVVIKIIMIIVLIMDQKMGKMANCKRKNFDQNKKPVRFIHV